MPPSHTLTWLPHTPPHLTHTNVPTHPHARSGKTSLINALAGRLPVGGLLEGDILVNGLPRGNGFRQISESAGEGEGRGEGVGRGGCAEGHGWRWLPASPCPRLTPPPHRPHPALSPAAYVLQDDVLFANLTVRETFEFAARMRLPADVAPATKAALVDDIITELGLAKAANTFIGGWVGGWVVSSVCSWGMRA